MPHFVRLFLLFLPFIYSSREADRYFFKGSKIHKAFLPSNPLTRRGIPHPTYFIRRWEFKNCRFRLSFNPVRCNKGKVAGTHVVGVSLMDDHLPLQPLTLNFNNSFILSRPKQSNPIGDLETRNLKYFITRSINGQEFPRQGVKSEFLLNMENSHFYVKIHKPYMTFYLFKENSKKLILRSTIVTNNNSTRYFTFYSNFWRACPAYISIFDDDFPDWVPGKNMSIMRGKKQKDRSFESCFSSCMFSIVSILLFSLLFVKLFLPGILNAYFPILGGAENNERKRKDMAFGSCDPADTIFTTTAQTEEVKWSAEKLQKTGSNKAAKLSGETIRKYLRSAKSAKKKVELKKSSQLNTKTSQGTAKSKKTSKRGVKSVKSLKLVTPSSITVSNKTAKIPDEKPVADEKPSVKQSMLISMTGASHGQQEDLTQKSMR